MLKENFTTRYFLDKDNTSLIEIPHEEKRTRRDGKDYYVEPTKHIGLLKYYTKETPELEKQINTLRKPNEKNLIKIAQNYHNAVCDDEQCIIYERKQTEKKIELEITASILWLGFDKDYLSGMGIVANIEANRYLKHLYLRTGIIYGRLVRTKITSMLKLPVQAVYIVNSRHVQPKIAAGVNICGIHNNNQFAFEYLNSVMVGANIDTSKKLSISLGYDLDFKLYLFKPTESKFLHGASVGVVIHL